MLHTSQQKADRYFSGGRFRGLKEGLRSTSEYVTGVPEPAIQLKLR